MMVTPDAVCAVMDRLIAGPQTGKCNDVTRWFADWYKRDTGNPNVYPACWWDYCIATCGYAFAHAGGASLLFPRAFVPWAIQDAMAGRNGLRWVRGAAGMRRGDVVFFDWSRRFGSPEHGDHATIAGSDFAGGRFLSLEGNAGGGNFARVWRDATYVFGYARPKWPATTAGNTTTPPVVQTVYREGDTGPKVAAIQRIVGADPDGVWGPKTTVAVKIWQRLHGLDPDGEWGPKSEAAAQPKPPAPTPSPRKVKPMILVQKQGRPEVYVSDLLTRRHVKSPAALRTVQAQLKRLGLPTDVQVVADLDPFGRDATGEG